MGRRRITIPVFPDRDRTASADHTSKIDRNSTGLVNQEIGPVPAPPPTVRFGLGDKLINWPRYAHSKLSCKNVLGMSLSSPTPGVESRLMAVRSGPADSE